jgi:hypothetical protein
MNIDRKASFRRADFLALPKKQNPTAVFKFAIYNMNLANKQEPSCPSAYNKTICIMH